MIPFKNLPHCLRNMNKMQAQIVTKQTAGIYINMHSSSQWEGGGVEFHSPAPATIEQLLYISWFAWAFFIVPPSFRRYQSKEPTPCLLQFNWGRRILTLHATTLHVPSNGPFSTSRAVLASISSS